ncbi:MAG: di-heme oxidoredictase family protein [Candidatus Sulfotelmatobacter sp.]
MKDLVIRMLRLPATTLLFSSLTVLVSAPMMYGQAPVNPATFDPGPRNPGNQNAICPTGSGVKFPSGNMGPLAPATTDCVDILQPPSVSPQPPAGGAGNVVGGYLGVNLNVLFPDWVPGLNTFSTIASVIGSAGIQVQEPMVGLGPSFNAQSCEQCHMVPAVGGSSPGIVSIQTSAASPAITFAMPIPGSPPPLSASNPQIGDATDDGGTNTIPFFPPPFSLPGVTTPLKSTVPVDGPVIEVRFVEALAPSGNEAGVGANGVGNLFTIQGRKDLPAGCSINQINFQALPNGSISFRIPTPTFGLGFVESTPDPILIENSERLTASNTLGVVGATFNTSGNDGTITRFGWKAQNKSLLIFAGEAENVEMGVTNELFPNERTWGATPPPISTGPPTSPLTVPPCINNSVGYPEDEILPTGNAATAASNAQLDSIFMLLNAAPSQCSSSLSTGYGTSTPNCQPFTTAENNGQTLFTAVGCHLCHSPTLQTGPSPNVSLSSVPYHPYSDFALHHMGGLSDGITQGNASGDQFRTAPLWGLGQRLFFLHDGREVDLRNAIQDHCIPTTSSTVPASEACGSVGVFNSLGNTAQEDILDFLRSL